MTQLLKKAFQRISHLPAKEQDSIAHILLHISSEEESSVEEETKNWEKLFSHPKSETLFKKMKEQAKQEVENGEVYDFDPASLPR